VSSPRALPHATGTLLLLLALAPAVAAAAVVPTVKPVPARTRVHAAFVPGEVVVALPAGERFTRGARGEALVPDARRTALLADLGLVPVRVLGDDPGATLELSSGYALLRSASPGFDPVAASAALRESGLFRAVSPNYDMRLFTTLPNDTYLGDQWYVQGSLGEDIHLPDAWDTARGDTSVVIALLDTGVDLGHPDLASQIWTNRGEIPGNGIDDDGNGRIDDVHGWDFGDGDNDPDPGPMIDEIGLDEGFHGTFCAGIASAATNNVAGIAGAGWRCRIMPLKIFDSTGNATTASIADAFGYAIAKGASVISMSFGGPGDPGVPEFFQALVDDANAAGIICVAAAGNDGVDTAPYPAACAHVIAVGATTQDNLRADFSNFGPWVDVAAPGSTMWSTICRNYVIDDLSQIFYLYFFGWDGENPYMFGDGTSFACPLVAGVCGLVRAIRPGITSDQMAAHLIATGDVVAYDEPIGPKVNAYRAVTTGLVAVGDAAPSRLALYAPAPNPSLAIARLSFTLPESGPVELAVFDAAGRRVRTLALGDFAAGMHQANWDGTDESGSRAGAGLYFARLTQAGHSRTTRIVRLAR
jgi:subtilisin family serine protease